MNNVLKWVTIVVVSAAAIGPLANCLASCDDVRFVGYDAIGWENGDYDAIYDDKPFLHLSTDRGYSGYTYGQSHVLGMNLISTTEYPTIFDGAYAGQVVTHGASGLIMVEFCGATPNELGALYSSAIAQGLCSYDNEQDRYIFVEGVSVEEIGEVDTYAYGIAVTEAWFRSHRKNLAASAFFFNATCYGYDNADAYLNDLTKQCLVGPWSSYNIGTIASAFGELYDGMSCNLSPTAKTIGTAYRRMGPLGGFLGVAGYTEVRLHPCRSCNNDVTEDDAVFGRAVMEGGELDWYLRRQVGVDRFVVSRLSGEGRVFEAELIKPAGMGWSEKYSSPISARESDYVVDAYAGHNLVGSKIVKSNSGLGRWLPDLESASKDIRIANFSKHGASVDWTKNSVDVVIAVQSEIPYDISALTGFYASQGKSYALIYDRDYMDANFVRTQYASFVGGETGPLLVLVGISDANHPSTHQGTMPSGSYDDYCGGCETGGICYSDYFMTDIDLDGVPNGPVVRVPAISHAELNQWVSNAIDYNMGIHMPAYPYVSYLCGDRRDLSFFEEFMGFKSSYRTIGYYSNPMLRESEYPSTIPNLAGWSDFASQLENGLSELWVAGSATDAITWTSVLNLTSGFSFEEWDQGVSREQGYIAWGATCATATLGTNGYVSTTGSLGRALLNGTSSRAVAVVGHLNPGWGANHEALRRYLLEERLAAIPGETTVADIAFGAVRRMCIDYPDLASHATGLTVWGCNVTIQETVPVAVNEGLPEITGLLAAVPNPFNPETEISFNLSRRQSVTLRVFDVSGRLVRVLLDSEMADVGRNRVTWNGRNDGGSRVASGTYFYRLDAGEFSECKRMALIK